MKVANAMFPFIYLSARQFQSLVNIHYRVLFTFKHLLNSAVHRQVLNSVTNLLGTLLVIY